jgi:ABC-type phosphate/phosphonate transport system substrate-binding protein
MACALMVVLLMMVSLAGPGWAQTPLGPSGPVSFGVVPQQTARELARVWTPILTYLHTKTGYDFWLQTAPDIPTFEARLAAGAYDLAYMNPYHYVVFHQTPGYVAFAKEKAQQVRGIVVVHKDSPYQSLPDLRDHTLAFPAPAAFAASVLTQAHLAEEGVPFTPVYVVSHDSVYLSVAQGLYVAGGGMLRTLQMAPPAVRHHLRILWTSPPYPSHAFAAHPRVPVAIVEQVLHAMGAMHQDPEGLALLQPLQVQGLDAAHDHEWDAVRTLHIQVVPHREGP